jgi:hypothetical protein
LHQSYVEPGAKFKGKRQMLRQVVLLVFVACGLQTVRGHAGQGGDRGFVDRLAPTSAHAVGLDSVDLADELGRRARAVDATLVDATEVQALLPGELGEAAPTEREADATVPVDDQGRRVDEGVAGQRSVLP